LPALPHVREERQAVNWIWDRLSRGRRVRLNRRTESSSGSVPAVPAVRRGPHAIGVGAGSRSLRSMPAITPRRASWYRGVNGNTPIRSIRRGS